METSLQQRIGWVDLLRVIACFLMVVSHCCDPFVAQSDNDPAAFFTGALTGSFVRACVPLFVMMTGVLLLPVRMEIGAFYRKRIGRILLALVFWSLALPLLYFVYMHFVETSSPCIDPAIFTWSATLYKMWAFLLNFTFDATPLWYLYMLVGLYFILPILSAWLDRASKRDVQILLGVWGATLLLPYLRFFAPMVGYTGNGTNRGLFGVCDWNEFGTFYYVSGFAGYLLLAFYLVKFPNTWSLRRTLGITIPVFAAGYLITAVGFLAMHHYSPENFANMEIVWYFSGINVAMMTWALFVLAQKLPIAPRPWLAQLAGATFGIYLCHFIFVQGAYDLLGGLNVPIFVRIMAMAIAAFGVSYLVVRIMSFWRATRRVVS